ncbi:hypothetical protein GCM10028791_35810 [Echinicola sediminis]
MKPVLKNIIAVLAGLLVGSLVNMGIIMISGMVITPPEGADVTTMEGLKESIHLFQPRHYIMPFLAHALGTFAGAYLAALIAANNKLRWALLVGAFFLVGGISNVFMIPSPAWFIALDLIVAYIPMAYLGGKIVGKPV